jgi:hypothetical protein
MKRLAFPILIILFLSCEQTVKKESEVDNSPNPNKEVAYANSVLDDIKSYYKKTYGQDARVEEKYTDSTLELTYHNPSKEEDYSIDLLIAISIPKNTTSQISRPNLVLKGDLNNDGFEDLIISVSTEGGGAGGNIWWDDIFVFLNNKGKQVLASVNRSDQISGCSDGQFFCSKIEGGYLIGNSKCYAEGDSRCCPSLEYSTKVKLKNEKLVFFTSTKLK